MLNEIVNMKSIWPTPTRNQTLLFALLMHVCVLCIFAKSNQPHAIKLDNYDVLTYFNAVLWNGIFMRMNNVPLCICACEPKAGYK